MTKRKGNAAMIQFLLSDLYDIVRGAKRAVAVIVFSISITTAVILAFLSMLVDTVGTLQDLEYDSRFYSIPILTTNTVPRMESVNRLLFGDYPEIRSMYPCQSYSFKLGGSDSIMSGGQTLAIPTEFEGYPVVDPSFCPFLYIPSPHLLRGRWFTGEEILNGANVVVLSQPWLEEKHPELDPWTLEQFPINGVPYQVVGIADGRDDMLESFHILPNYIPYRTLERNETETTGYVIAQYQVFIEFARPLTKEQRIEIGLSFAQGGYVDLPMSNLDMSGTGYLANALLILGIAVVMIFVCALNIMGLYSSMLKMNSYRYMVYKVCGARRAAIARTLRFTTVCITALSSAAGCLLFWPLSLLVPASYFPLYLPWYGYLLVVLLMTGLLLLVIRPMIRDLSRRQPLDRQWWR